MPIWLFIHLIAKSLNVFMLTTYKEKKAKEFVSYLFLLQFQMAVLHFSYLERIHSTTRNIFNSH